MARLLTDWLTSYLEYTSPQEAPTAFHFWTGVATIAAALRRKVHFNQLYYDWSPNFYIILVAPPGVSKSSALSMGMGMLDDIQGIKKGADSLTWQALVQSMEAATEMVQTPDGFLAISCLTFSASELGSLLDPDDRKMLDVLTDLWDGKCGLWERATKTMGGNKVPNPWINMIAGTTPTWIASNFPRQAVGAGFASRCVFVYSEHKHHLMAYPRYTLAKSQNLEHMKELKHKLLRDLEHIAMMQGEFDLTPDAIEWGEGWYAEHHKSPPASLAGDEQFSGYINRKQGHVHKLAMVLSASRNDNLIIDRGTLEAAMRLISELEAAMPEVFRNMNTTDQQSGAIRIIEKVRANGTISKDSLYRMFLRQMGYKEFNEAIDSAIAAKLLKVKMDTSGVFVEVA